MKRGFTLTLLFLCGCLKTEMVESTTVYFYDPMQFYLGLAGGIVMAVLGLTLPVKGRFKALLVLGGLAIAAVSPSVKYHYVRLNPERMEMSHGAWWKIQHVTVDFPTVVQIDRTVETRNNAVGKKSDYRIYVFTTSEGAQIKVPRGELVAAAEEQLLQIASDRAIPVSGTW
jgi:hypothetical protein